MAPSLSRGVILEAIQGIPREANFEKTFRQHLKFINFMVTGLLFQTSTAFSLSLRGPSGPLFAPNHLPTHLPTRPELSQGKRDKFLSKLPASIKINFLQIRRIRKLIHTPLRTLRENTARIASHLATKLPPVHFNKITPPIT